MSGLYGVIGIMMALRSRDATGQGQMIDVALYESVWIKGIYGATDLIIGLGAFGLLKFWKTQP